MVTAAVCAVVAGYHSYTAIGEWVADVPAATALALGIAPDRRPSAAMTADHGGTLPDLRCALPLGAEPRWSDMLAVVIATDSSGVGQPCQGPVRRLDMIVGRGRNSGYGSGYA
ncbi:hypothetical protein [Plantactinospora sp. CA-290183]|uniref:hypothetical protein n=1 Tax=Plantactinospora sp. CA-290183 TaxID=3240006 RepID=UPI003D8B5D0B